MQNNDKLMKALEEEFLRKVEAGESIREYLHIPYTYLTQVVKEGLDSFLMEEAYSILSDPTFDPKDFKVYSDDKMEIRLDDPEQQIIHVDRMLEKYQKEEAYERCHILQTIKQQIQQK